MVAEDCELWPGPPDRADRITVVLPRPADPSRAPWARNEGEELLFRHLYEPLFYIDCRGELLAGLAASWKKGEGGRRWTFEIRKDAFFWDGTAVTARDVAESWLDVTVHSMTREAGIDSTVVGGDRILHVYMERPTDKVPRVLSELAFAVTKPPAELPWPVGSGPYEIVGPATGRFGPRGRSIRMIPSGGASGPVIQCFGAGAEDARDLMDRGADVTVTADPDVIDYATGQSGLEVVALPWSRTYVLLSTSRARSVLRGETPAGIPAGLTDGMARDAVRQDARGCRGPFWWEKAVDCPAEGGDERRLPDVPPGARPESGVRRVLYDTGDPVARALAGRIVALASARPDDSPDAGHIREVLPGLSKPAFGVIADGVSESILEESLRGGEDFAYIVALPSRPADVCHAVKSLKSRARWLVPLNDRFPRAVVPLVDTRLHAIFRGDRVGLAAGYRGVFLLLEKITRVDDPS